MNRQPSAPPDLEGFQYLELLGIGGFADVFLYEQSRLRRKVGVKVLLRDLGAGAQNAFEAEANLMAQLSNHPSIVSIYQAGAASDGRPYLVMEYCPPPHLAIRIKAKPLTVGKALEIGVQIASAVETAHRLGIVHRDIKPANILFTQYNRPALTDFGISATMGDPSVQGMGMSVPWAPPEQLSSGHELVPASDVYSLAATIWTTLTSHSPFEVRGGPNDPYSMSRRIKSDPPPPTGREDVPESLERVLRTAMAKRPDMRYQSAVEFARALQGVQAELHQSVTPLDVPDEQAPEHFLDEPDDTGTVLDRYVPIDPDGDVAASTNTFSRSTPVAGVSTMWSSGVADGAPTPVIVRAGGSAPQGTPRDFTQLPVPQLGVDETIIGLAPDATASGGGERVAVSSAGGAEGQRRRRPGLVIGIVVGAVVIAAGILVGQRLLTSAPAAAQDQASASAASQPLDPIGGVVPTPAGLSAKASGKSVSFTWKNPDPRGGDTFLYQVDDTFAVDVTAVRTTKTSVTVPALTGRTCLRVRLARSNGRYSAWTEPACKP